MGTAVINRTNIETQAQDNILSIIDNRNYILDPRSPNSTTKNRIFVYEFDPFQKAINFGDFPYIILEFPSVEYSKVSVDGRIKDIGWKHIITARSARDGAGNSRTNVGRNDILNIGDNLNKTFNSEIVKQSMRKVGMYKLNLIKLDSNNAMINEKHLFETTYELSYIQRLQVSE